MEVHHHPDMHHKGKHFKEYVLEFMMIFLAVTMGFFAESLREHIADNKKGRQIIVALQKDIAKDTTRLHNLIDAYVPRYHAWVDSSHQYVDSLSLKGNERKISKALFNATFWETYTPPEIALTILKNSGTFNLIENEKVKKEILEYSVTINNFNKYSEFITAVEHSIDTSFTALVSRDVARKFLDGLSLHNSFLTDGDVPQTIIFKTYNKEVFKRYIDKLDQVDFEIHDISGFYNGILNAELRLLKLIDNEYHLDNE